MRWEVKNIDVEYDSRFTTVLEEGWEPFAVSHMPQIGLVLWVRRRIS